MATCPNCKGHLTDGHRCPRRRGFVIAEIVGCAFAGGFLGWLSLLLFDPGVQTHMDAVAVTIGAVTGIAINRLLRS